MAKKKQQESAREHNGASEDKIARPAIELEIEHRFQPVSQFSNHLIVQADGECVYLSFFQVNPPFVFVPSDTDEEKLSALKKSGRLVAECVARVAIPKGKLGPFVEAIRKITSKVESGQGIEIKGK